MTPTHPFRSAVESRDLKALAATLAVDVKFYAPIRFKPFVGRDEALGALSLAGQLFAFQPGFRYTAELQQGQTLALVFQAEIDGRFLEGVDLLHLDADDQVAELRVTMRPHSAVQDLVRLTTTALEAIHVDGNRR